MTRKFSIEGSPRPKRDTDQLVSVKLTRAAVFFMLHSLLGTLEKNGGEIGDAGKEEPVLEINFYGTLKENMDVPVGSLIETA